MVKVVEACVERLAALLAAARGAAGTLEAGFRAWVAAPGAAAPGLPGGLAGAAERFVAADRDLARVLEEFRRLTGLPPEAGVAELLARIPPALRGPVEEEYRAFLVSLEGLRRSLAAAALVADRGARVCRRLHELLVRGAWPGYGRTGRFRAAGGPETWTAHV
ncbi:MAG: hypothetical protein ACUVTQ_05300 [Desulfotomaculales bacterium]